MAKLFEITDENFKKEVLENTKPYSVTFSDVSFCAPCRQLHEILQREVINHPIAQEVNFGTVEVSGSGINISSTHGIKGIPTTILYKNGEQIAQKVGAVPAQTFITWVKESIV